MCQSNVVLLVSSVEFGTVELHLPERRLTNYPDRLGPSGKFIENSTKLALKLPLSDQMQNSVMASRTSNRAWSKGSDAGICCK
jgi:hypothetical protein